MGQYRPGSNGPMVRSANMSLMTSPRPQPNVRDETSMKRCNVSFVLHTQQTPKRRMFAISGKVATGVLLGTEGRMEAVLEVLTKRQEVEAVVQ